MNVLPILVRTKQDAWTRLITTFAIAKSDLMASIAKTTSMTAHQILAQTTVPVMTASTISHACASQALREIPVVRTSIIAPRYPVSIMLPALMAAPPSLVSALMDSTVTVVSTILTSVEMQPVSIMGRALTASTSTRVSVQQDSLDSTVK